MFGPPDGGLCQLKTLQHILLFLIVTLVIGAEMDSSIFVYFSVIAILHFQSHFLFHSDAPVCRWLTLTSWHSQHTAQPMAWSPPRWILVSTVLCCVLKDHIIYLNRTLVSVSQALAVVTNMHTTRAPSLFPMNLPTTRALSPLI
jgi:hypothetical protein